MKHFTKKIYKNRKRKHKTKNKKKKKISVILSDKVSTKEYEIRFKIISDFQTRHFI